MRQRLIDMLKLLEAAIPPPPNCHHAITYAQYGSDQVGWEDRLALQVNQGGKFHCFFLDEEDFKKPALVVSEIAAGLARLSTGREQLGIGPGQYIG